MPEQSIEMTTSDDTGSDTFSRYVYQAHVAFPFCMACASGNDVRSVVLEHIEDIAVEGADGWRLIQIKTRSPERGLWSMGDLTKKGSGPFRSLHRSFESGLNANGTLEMHLQGFLNRRNVCSHLRTREGRQNKELLDAVQKTLEIGSVTDCQAFLERVRVVEGLPPLDSIISQNLRLLGDLADHLQVRTIFDVYDSVVSKIEKAMTAGKLDPSWWSIVLSTDSPSASVIDALATKRLIKEQLEPIFAPLASPATTLLSRLINPDTARPSTLVQKLQRGGATDNIVTMAQSLRASAAARESVRMSSTLSDERAILEDVCTRLQSHFVGIHAMHATHPRPAIPIWSDVMARLATAALITDPNRIFQGDPQLLMGELCQMADRCEIDWGTTDE